MIPNGEPPQFEKKNHDLFQMKRRRIWQMRLLYSHFSKNLFVLNHPGVVRYRKINFLYGVLGFIAYGLRRFLRPQFFSLSLFLRCFLRHLFIAILGRFSSEKSSQMSCFPKTNRPIVQKPSFSRKKHKIF